MAGAEAEAEAEAEAAAASLSLCKDHVPNLLSSFVDTFVDFSVSGLFLLPQQPPPQPTPTPTTRLPSPDRLIAIGDLHGDLHKSEQALRLANLIDHASHDWIGGSTTVVQIGDVLDRGGEELKILYLLEKLKRDASRTGGTILTMNGNHEIMNMEGDFSFVTKAGLDEFKSWAYWFRIGNQMKSLCEGVERPRDPFEGIPRSFRGVKEEFFEGIRARIAALRPEGPIATRFLSQNSTVLVVGDSVFVHGGILPEHVSYGMERINEEVRDWMNGSKGRYSPDYCRGRNGVVWVRKFSRGVGDCETLEHVLRTIPGAKRMIMGHTIQELGINGVCDDRAIRIDVGMSKGCINGLPEVLEIDGRSDRLRILTLNPLHEAGAAAAAAAALFVPAPEKQHSSSSSLSPPKQVQVKA